jgi:hypothetical protein
MVRSSSKFPPSDTWNASAAGQERLRVDCESSLQVTRGLRGVQAKERLRVDCERELVDYRTRIFTPKDGEVVDVSEGAASFSVLLSDSLLASTHMRVMADAQLGWLYSTVGSIPEVS